MTIGTMNITERIDAALSAYLSNNSQWPRFLYLGGNEMTELDKMFEGIVLEWKDMAIVMVYKDSFLSLGL